MCLKVLEVDRWVHAGVCVCVFVCACMYLPLSVLFTCAAF